MGRMAMKILLILGILVGLSLFGCAYVHPAEEIPDVVVWEHGHKWFGYRNRHKCELQHSMDCPHPSHTAVIFRVVIIEDTVRVPGITTWD